MKSAVETLSPTRVRLTVEVPFDELKPALDQAYRDVAKQINIPGFRRGKVPPPVIDRQVGRSYVIAEAINATIPRVFSEAVRENEIEPLGEPDYDLGDELPDGTDLNFTVEIDVRPEFEVPEYDGLEVTVDDATVTDETVDERLTELRGRFGTLRAVERPVEDDDHLTIDLSASKDGEPIEDAQLTDYTYKVGSGALVDGLDDAVRGKSAGDEETFTSKLVAGEYADQDVDVKVAIKAVKAQELPELDDDFAQLASEFDTLDELTADLRANAERSKRLEQADQARNRVIEKVIGLAELPLPEATVGREIENRKENLRHELGHLGLTWDAYLKHNDQTETELDAELDEQVRRAMRTQFVLDKVADAESVPVGQEELGQYLYMQAARSGVDPQQYMDQIVQQGLVPQVVREVRRNKALAVMAEKAAVTDESGNPVELKRLRPDGTLGEEPTEEPAEAESTDEAEKSEA